MTDIPLLLSIQEWDREKARHTQNENLQFLRDFWEERDTFSLRSVEQFIELSQVGE